MKDVENKLIKKGYKEYPKGVFAPYGVIRFFQKRFDDDIGKKYFINVNEWDIGFPNGKGIMNGYSYEVQLYSKNAHAAIDLTFHSEWDIDEVEKYVDELFSNGKFDYYEEF